MKNLKKTLKENNFSVDNEILESWIYIGGCKTTYKIRSDGTVLSTQYHGKPREKYLEMKGGIDADGYRIVSLTVNGKKTTCKIHRLVAIHFIPNLKNKPEVNHINGNKLDNNVYNLEWVTSYENTHHAMKNNLRKSSLTEDTVIKICKLLSENKKSLKEISDITNVSKAQIYKIRKGRIWKNISKNFNVENYIFAEHINYSKPKKKVDDDTVKSICDDLENDRGSFSKIGKKHNVLLQCVKRIFDGEYHKNISSKYNFSNYTKRKN